MTSTDARPQRRRPPRGEPMSTSDDLVALSRQKWAWMSAREVDKLESLFHDEAIFVHMGATFTKADELEVIRSGRIHYRDVDIEDVSVRIVEGTGIVLSTIVLVAVVNGEEVSNPFAVTEVYVRRGDAWALGSMSFTRLINR